ncbi:HutD family protein [Acidovorax sp. Root70]|uniref:HutD/Ves family protein n=1 Tax=Acidovorax sp. Root70 TaxID=1736590 RepID=UPI0006FF7928|nr:HutD family protein [Acidovorax sp. Root70]KRB27871.1 HutD [Acidovorax sp. Root70]
MQFLDLAATPSVPWKNGGGSTRELACWPPGAGMDGFGWRVSVATIAHPGPFSAFPGVDRQIMLLEGDGVHLQGAAGHWQHALERCWQPFAFSGDEPVDCRMLGGVSTDFNLMLRRGAWNGKLEVVHDVPPPAGGAAAGLCMVLQGAWRCEAGDTHPAQVLTAGQGVWWVNEGTAVAPSITPARATKGAGSADDAPVLAWVALHTVSAP